MKVFRNLAIMLAALFCAASSFAAEIIYGPQGEQHYYEAKNEKYIRWWTGGMASGEGGHMAYRIVFDDASGKAWISDMCALSDAWTECNIEGNRLVVHSGQPMFEYNQTVYCLYACIVNTSKLTIKVCDNVSFVMSEDRQAISLERVSGGKPSEMYMLITAPELSSDVSSIEWGPDVQWGRGSLVFEELPEPVTTIPDTAECERFQVEGNDSYSGVSDRVWVGINGNEAYISNLAGDNDTFAIGTVDADGNITILSGQYLGLNGKFPVRLWALTCHGDDPEDEGFVAENIDRLTLFYDKESCSYHSSEDMALGFGPTQKQIEGLLLSPAFNIVEVKSATPADIEMIENKGSVLRFVFPIFDVYGEELDLGLAVWSLVVDGEKYIFNPSDYNISDTTTDFHYNTTFYDYNYGSYGFSSDGYHYVPLPDCDYSSLDLMITYKVKDTINTTVAHVVTGINDVPAEQSPDKCYSISGVRLSHPMKGINVISGRKILVR